MSVAALDAAGHATTTAQRTVRVRDLVAPTVLGVEPANGAIDVPVSTSVRLTFSEAIAPATATSASVRLEDAGGTPVAATLSFGAGNTTVTILPSAPLDDGVPYGVRVEPSLTDTSGNALAAAFASSFTTDLDESGPQLLLLVPANGAVGVSIRPLLRARFDDVLDRSSVAPEAFQLLDVDGGDAPVEAEIAFENGDRDVVLRATGALGFDRAYALSLAGTLRGTDGNAIYGTDGAPLVHGFRTGLFGITAPRDASAVTEGASLGIEAQASVGLGVTRVEFSVNGLRIATLESPPYRATFTVPAAATTPSLAIGAVAREAVIDVTGLAEGNTALQATSVSGNAAFLSGSVIWLPLPKDGVLIFDSFQVSDLPGGGNATVSFARYGANPPVRLLVAGDFRVGVGDVISVSGNAGAAGSDTAGPGRGGAPGLALNPNTPVAGEPGLYGGAPDLLPLAGGSGGGGSSTTHNIINAAGGGGGGAILVAVNGTLTVDGTIRANGSIGVSSGLLTEKEDHDNSRLSGRAQRGRRAAGGAVERRAANGEAHGSGTPRLPNRFFQRSNVPWLTRSLRHTSSTAVPSSTCRSAVAICSSLNRLSRIRPPSARLPAGFGRTQDYFGNASRP